MTKTRSDGILVRADCWRGRRLGRMGFMVMIHGDDDGDGGGGGCGGGGDDDDDDGDDDDDDDAT